MNDKYTIFLDMDGVICDFETAFERLTLEKFGKREHPKDCENRIGSKSYWDIIINEGIKFWSDMPEMNGWNILTTFIFDNFDKVNILSSSSKKNSGSEIPDIGKKEWLRKRNLYNKFDAVYIVDSAAHKKHYAFKTGILIDDYEKNINGWKDNGGIGILHKDIPSTIEQLKKYV